MNAIKRFIDLLKSPLIPIRLFATEESSSESSNTMESAEPWDDDYSWLEDNDIQPGYYDSDGTYLGDDDAAADEAGFATSDELSEDAPTGEVQLQTDGNGNIIGASYLDPDTGEWKESNYGGDRNTAANNIKNDEAWNVFGPSLTPETLAALNVANPADVTGVLEGAKAGNPAAVAMATAMTGTIPNPDSLKGLGYTDEQINTAITFAEALTQALAEGKGPNAAWKEASNKTGDPYGTNARDQYLKDSIMNTIGLFGGQIVGGLAGNKVAQIVARGAVKSRGAKSAAQLGVKGLQDIISGAQKAGRAVDKGSVLAGLVAAGVNNAKELVDQVFGDGKKIPEADSSSEDTRATADKTPDATPATSRPEPEAARSEPKSDVTITNNPFGNDGEPDISIPKGPLEGTPLSGTGLPGHESEPTKEDAEDRGFENDDSGSDTMEETSQDAPTSGLGGDTFSNPNDDAGKHGWGLGEEDPNRSNYDVDKWNRGMERVSTDVVSDEKCKNFIKKTFKDDPVLIKTVRIMKSL